MNTPQDPAQATPPPGSGKRVQPDGTLSGEVKRGGFTLDTSGFVWLQHGQLANTYWEDLTPFQQGYVEALLASISELPSGINPPAGEWRPFAFSDLAPEALAMILRDCERIHGRARGALTNGLARPTDPGGAFWRLRQRGIYGDDFPPLTPSLSDDGRVHLREAN